MLANPNRSSFLVAAALAAALLAPASAWPQVTKAHEIEYPPLPDFEVPEPTRVELAQRHDPGSRGGP